MKDRVRLCNCGLHKLHIGVDAATWYGSLHTELICYMTEEDKMCWCGNMLSMHWNGHAPGAAPPDDKEQADRMRELAIQRLFRERSKREIPTQVPGVSQTRDPAKETPS